VVEAVFEVAARKRVVLNQFEMGLLAEKLSRVAGDPREGLEGAELARQWIQAVQAGDWGGPIPLEGSAAEAVRRVLHAYYSQNTGPSGLGSLHDALDG
jgi:hypothetical protein